jgi:hypothetical protein
MVILLLDEKCMMAVMMAEVYMSAVVCKMAAMWLFAVASCLE